MKSPFKTLNSVVISLVGLAIVLGGCVSVYWVFNRYFAHERVFRNRPFDASDWAYSDAEHRGQMVPDMLAVDEIQVAKDIHNSKSRLWRLTSDQVVDLLGTPRSNILDDGGRPDLYIYDVGYMNRNPRAFLLEPYALMVYFDDNMTVQRVLITH